MEKPALVAVIGLKLVVSTACTVACVDRIKSTRKVRKPTPPPGCLKGGPHQVQSSQTKLVGVRFSEFDTSGV
ncbi:hypothetical protein QBC42DRAFT_284977 [Cladorrhinum samala]|uniref:Secreted protein n=1 Tax=Cladorrhinum samala TaxID=585594 RepID=A0AAV9HVR4_9PEZI|nr:hypothetical protein QBC42DRAFT_284977 [Cladorrhinum samala]